MIFKKITILILVTIFCFSNAIADNHDTEQNILDKAKEINEKIKKQQAEKNATTILTTNINNLHDVSKVLLEKETIDRFEFEDVIKNGITTETQENVRPRIRRKKT